MKKGKFVVFFIVSLFHIGLSAQTRLNGSFENTSYVIAGNEDFNFDNASLFKIVFQYKNDDFWRLYSDLRLISYYGLDNSQVEKDATVDFDISRLFIKANFGSTSFTLGRDYVSFGSPSLFNTLEWHKNFSLLDPTQAKPAINLLSFTVPMGSYGKFQSFVGGNDSWEEVLSGSEIVFGASGFEGGLAYQYKGSNNNVIGAFFKVDAFVTITGSYSFHANNVLIEDEKFSTSHEANVTFDYSFPVVYSSLLVNQSFYYNSAGAASLEEVQKTNYGDYFFKAMWYSYTSLVLSVDEFMSFSFDGLVSLVDTSTALIPSFNYSLTDGLLLDVSAGFYFGKENAEFSPLQKGIPNTSIMITVKASF